MGFAELGFIQFSVVGFRGIQERLRFNPAVDHDGGALVLAHLARDRRFEDRVGWAPERLQPISDPLVRHDRQVG